MCFGKQKKNEAKRRVRVQWTTETYVTSETRTSEELQDRVNRRERMRGGGVKVEFEKRRVKIKREESVLEEEVMVWLISNGEKKI